MFNFRVLSVEELSWLEERCESYLDKLLAQMDDGAQTLSHDDMDALKARYLRVQNYFDHRKAAHAFAKHFQGVRARVKSTGLSARISTGGVAFPGRLTQ